jgi:hypothetical protein
MVAGHAQQLVPPLAQPVQETAGFLELLRPGALREIAADDDKVGLERLDALLDAIDQPLVMSAKMQVGEVNDASHGY